MRTCVRACLDDVEPDLGGFECVGRARPLRHRVQLALDLSPGADVAAVRPVPVQMWRTFSLRYSPSGRSCTYVHVQLPVGCLSSDHSCGFSTYLRHTKRQCVATEHRQRLFIAKRCTADLSRRASVRLQLALRVGVAPSWTRCSDGTIAMNHPWRPFREAYASQDQRPKPAVATVAYRYRNCGPVPHWASEYTTSISREDRS